MTILNSEIIIANNIKLDKTYKNVLNYNENNMLNLVTVNKVANDSHYSFIKHGVNKIKTNFNYSVCLSANYMAFQNYDYSNKWFFAFIDSVEFMSEGVTVINFTVDIFATWFNSLVIKPCFVIREHVNNDALGLHTIPEGLELGDYVINSHLADSYNNQLTVVMGMTEDYLSNYDLGVNKYNGIPAPLTYYRFDSMVNFSGVLQGLQSGKADAIVSMYLAPKWLAPYLDTSTKVKTSDIPETLELGISRISTLNGYTPKNNKMLCYPFCYIALSNASGQYNIYKQEFWTLDENDEMIVRMYGSLTCGCSIRAIPINYNGNGVAWDDGITLGKFPALAWPNDVYTNWLTQNGVDLLGITTLDAKQSGILQGGSQAIIGALSGDYSSIGSGIRNIWDTMQEAYRKDMIPTGVRGSLNSGDVLTSAGANRLHAYRITVREEYAKIIDEFLSKFGYKVTELKIPNITGRRYWNFVQIGDSEVIGYGNIPADALKILNQIFRAGTTIWHNHDNIGNYNLDNTIV